ncbi:MAG TPA: cytochrome c [Allosphingosinicella sp.]|jgi:cytochrome c556
MKLAGAALALALTGCAATTNTAEAPAPPTIHGAGPAETVAARQATFNLTAATFGSMRAAVESGADLKSLTFGARGLNRWATALPGMFPAGTDLPASAALPTVWTDRPGFEARAAAFQAATADLLAAATANNKPAFAAAVKTTGAACGACHSTYRAEDAH